MSIKVFGILVLNNANMPTNEQMMKAKIDISFLITEKAMDNKLGINFERNIFDGFMKNYFYRLNEIPFELTNDPMDINADDLFSCDYIIDENDPLSESLKSRMFRVQKFLIELLKTRYVQKITLNVNALGMFGVDIETIEVNVDDFCKNMVSLYEKNNNWIPTVRIVIKE